MKETIRILEEEVKRCRETLKYDMEEIKELPADTVIAKKRGKKVYLYKKKEEWEPGTYRYKCIGNSEDADRRYIIGILRREILAARIKNTRKNLDAIDRIMPELESLDYQKIYEKMKCRGFPEYEPSDSCIRRIFLEYAGKEKEVNLWMKENKNENIMKPENLVHITKNGLRVRSKSELLIASALEERNLAFRYEPELKISGDRICRPDFEILRPSDMKTIYWEHFGLMSSPEYAAGASEKLMMYQKNGISMWDNLVISFDSKEGHFNMGTINKIIDVFLE